MLVLVISHFQANAKYPFFAPLYDTHTKNFLGFVRKASAKSATQVLHRETDAKSKNILRHQLDNNNHPKEPSKPSIAPFKELAHQEVA